MTEGQNFMTQFAARLGIEKIMHPVRDFIRRAWEKLNGRADNSPSRVISRQGEPPDAAVDSSGNAMPRKDAFQASLSRQEVQPPAPVIRINDRAAWDAYMAKLHPTKELCRFAEEHRAEKFDWCRKAIRDMENDLAQKQPPQEYETAGEAAAEFVQKCTRRWLTGLENCQRGQKNSDSQVQELSKKLADLVEDYLTQAEIKPLAFQAGDKAEEWHNLEMQDSVIVKTTDRAELQDTIYEVQRQPHVFDYIDEHGKACQAIFGGKCTIWAYQE